MKFKCRLIPYSFLPICLIYIPLFSADRIPLNVKKLSENVIIIQTRTGNSQVAVLKTEKGLVMIDTGFSPSFATELKELAERSFGQDDWAYLIQTNSAVLNNGGSQVFSGIPTIAHADAHHAFAKQRAELREYLNDRSAEFEERVQRAREQMKELDPQSERAAGLQEWIALCQRISQDFNKGFELALPTMGFTDQMTLHLGNLDVVLFYFGSAAELGDVICWVPQEGFVWLGDVFHAVHVLPIGSYGTRTADLPRWIWVFDQILNDENPVKHAYRCNGDDLWTVEILKQRRDFIHDLQEKIVKADAEGTPLHEVMDQFTNLDATFPYVNGWPNIMVPIFQSDIRRTVAAFWKTSHTSAADKIGGMIDSDSLKAARIYFDTIKNGTDQSFYFLESEFNALGYSFLGQNRFLEAIEVFKMNTELYSESANVYDSLGEAYMLQGNDKQAIQNYDKSLLLNPDNTNAKKMLKKLKDKK